MDLSPEFKLVPEERCFRLERLTEVSKRDGTSAKEWKVLGYYGDPSQADRSIVKHLSRDALALSTWAKFLKAFEEAVKNVSIIREQS